MGAKEDILAGKTALGIEFGSTRIKAILIGEDNTPIASGSHEWENQLVDHICGLQSGCDLGRTERLLSENGGGRERKIRCGIKKRRRDRVQRDDAWLYGI